MQRFNSPDHFEVLDGDWIILTTLVRPGKLAGRRGSFSACGAIHLRVYKYETYALQARIL